MLDSVHGWIDVQVNMKLNPSSWGEALHEVMREGSGGGGGDEGRRPSWYKPPHLSC